MATAHPPTRTRKAAPARRRRPAGVGTVGARLWLQLSDQTERFRRYRNRVLSGRNAEDLHQLRVTLRRLRAALEVGRESLDLPDAADAKMLARLGRALGKLRDIDVALEAIAPIVPVAKGTEAAALERVGSELRKERRAARRDVRRLLATAEVDRASKALRVWIRDPRFFPFGFRRLSPATRLLVRPVEQAFAAHPGWAVAAVDAAALAAEPTRILHELRKGAKDLRYRIEVLSTPGSKRQRQRLEELREIQDRLGQLHDASMISALALGAGKREIPALLQRHLATNRVKAGEGWVELRARIYKGTVSTADGAA